MKFSSTQLDGVVLIEPSVYSDTRGFFLESYQKDIFRRNGIRKEFVQDNHSASKKNVFRGLHYQIRPFEQAKLVQVISGAIWDVIVDIRRKSKTFGQWEGFELNAQNHKMLYIPEGFAHGFLALEENTHVIYKTSRIYSPKHESGILWSDPEMAIQWPVKNPVVNERDQSFPVLKNQSVLF